jgi:hypothetical protein
MKMSNTSFGVAPNVAEDAAAIKVLIRSKGDTVDALYSRTSSVT